jgi:hypothetical protein
MRMFTVVMAAILTACPVVLCAQGGVASLGLTAPSSHGLQVNMLLGKSSYIPGERLDLRVQFRNVGTTTIRIGRALGTATSAPFRLSATIEDSRGHVVLDAVRDAAELPCADLREFDPQRPTAIWVELAPGATYEASTTIATKNPLSECPRPEAAGSHDSNEVRT